MQGNLSGTEPVIQQDWVTSPPLDNTNGTEIGQVENPEDLNIGDLDGVGDIFTPINSTRAKKPTFRVPGEIGVILGDLEKEKLAITLEGDQGAGKTQIVFDLIEAFAQTPIIKRIAFFSLEIGANSSIIDKYKSKYFSPSTSQKVIIAGEAPEGIDTIRKVAAQVDMVVIDSWTAGRTPDGKDWDTAEFDNLRREFPDTVFLVIFQRTSGKEIRGGTKPLFDAGINIEVKKVDDTFVNNYAYASKNRYGATGIKYNVFNRKIVRE